MKKAFLIPVLGLILAAAAPASAHHGWGNYEATAKKTTGVLTAVEYANPHASVRLKAEGKEYTVILAPISRMTSRGLPDGVLKTGKTVTVDAYANKSDPSELRAERIMVDNKTVELR